MPMGITSLRVAHDSGDGHDGVLMVLTITKYMKMRQGDTGDDVADGMIPDGDNKNATYQYCCCDR